MDNSLSDLQELNPSFDWSDAASVNMPEWLLGKAHIGRDEFDLNAGVLLGILDPKAACMYELYVHHGLRFAWENKRFRLIMLAWQIHTLLHAHGKRAFDLLVVLGSLPIVVPIMLFTAIAIKLESSGPVIFRQERVGKWGSRFTCYKFRSMSIDAEARKEELMASNEADEVIFKMKHDPRVTRVGQVIRKLSIDELPQVFNVIMGDMSLVGPRPPIPVELDGYQFDTFRRLDAVPGLTGLQQVSGRSDLPFKRWVELDIKYIREQSLKKDIEILFRTIPAVLSRKGAY